MSPSILALIGSRIRDRSEIPASFEALTVPVMNDDIIRSMWFTLGCCSDVLATVEDQAVVFWRKRRRPHCYKEQIKAEVKTR